jgi:hypothetical protein
VAAPDGTGFRTLADGQGPSWSADSRELAFFRQDGVYTIGVGGGTPTRIGDGSSPAWSPDGSVAVIDHGVVLIQAPGSTRLLSTLEPRPPLLWSPSGDLLAFAGLTDGAVYVYSFTGPTLRFFPRTFGVPMAWSDDEHELFLRGGDSFFSGVPGVRRFPLGEDVEAISADRGHVAVGVVAGRFGYAGSDLYVADGDGLHSHLVSPPRCASPSPHCLEGTDGADKLVGTAQYDIVFGRAGDDEIYGLAGPNHLEGAFGRDLLVGGPKNDVIDGQLGNDHLIGGAGIDYLDGGPGDDLIETGRGTDYVGGGPGNDRILAADGWRDGIDCGPGNDTVVTDPADHLELCEHVRRRKPAK